MSIANFDKSHKQYDQKRRISITNFDKSHKHLLHDKTK